MIVQGSFLCCLVLLSVVVLCVVSDNESNSLYFNLSLQELSGVYDTQEWNIAFNTAISNDTVSSSTLLTYGDISLATELSYPNIHDYYIPDIVDNVITSANTLALHTNCDMPRDLSSLYEEFADALYRKTDSCDIANHRLRFAVMYHVSVVRTAKRMCERKRPLCTQSPAYTFQNQLLVCSEDVEEMFSNLYNTIPDALVHTVIKRTAKKSGCHNSLGWNLRGKDTCCCMNYPGCCVFALKFCCWHDFACTCCQHWYCGGLCKPNKSCLKKKDD